MHKVFVYGSLLSGMINHRILENSDKLGIAHSPKGFGLVDLGAFPGAIKVNDPEVSIIGEVYEVDDITLRRLNSLEGYREGDPEGGLYNRLEIDTKFGKAFIYTINGHWHKDRSIVKEGDWRKHLTAKRYKVS